MILNADVDFVRAAPDDHQKAFLAPPRRIQIPDGTQIYRWCDHRLSPDHRVSPWWSFVESKRLSNDESFDGFRVREERARRIGKTHREYARARLALAERFENNMTLVVLARLKIAVWGFLGKVGAQQEFDYEKRKDQTLKNVFFIGGSYQLWIPNLKYPEHLRDESVLPAGPTSRS
jgi:hypothetical protein